MRGLEGYPATMPQIHPTATLGGGVELAADGCIGPQCGLTGPVRVGAGTRLIGHAYLQGPLEMGDRNTVYPFVCLGFAPQHIRFDPETPGHGLRIGDRNVFRESVTVHRAFEDEGPTAIGDDNYFMTCSHVGHDVRLGNHVSMNTGAALGGHVEIEDRVIVGGGSVVHQFVRVGEGAMISGGIGMSQDVLPWFMLTGINVVGSVNLIGMRRSGMSRDDIDDVRWVYRILCRQGLSVRSAVERLQERVGRPRVDAALAFIEGSSKGICTARQQLTRGSGGAP